MCQELIEIAFVTNYVKYFKQKKSSKLPVVWLRKIVFFLINIYSTIHDVDDVHQYQLSHE